jgi:hypothetical protein
MRRAQASVAAAAALAVRLAYAQDSVSVDLLHLEFLVMS